MKEKNSTHKYYLFRTEFIHRFLSWCYKFVLSLSIILCHQPLNNILLIDNLEHIRRTEQYQQSTADCDPKEYVQYQSVNDHRHVLPIVTGLQGYCSYTV